MAITGADGATVQLLDPHTQQLTFGATKGLDPRLVAQFEHVDANSGSSCGRALAARQRTIATLRDLIHGTEATCILIEHDMDVIRRACDRIYVLSRGAVIKEGSWEQTSQDEAVKRAYLGSGPRQENDGAEPPTDTAERGANQ